MITRRQALRTLGTTLGTSLGVSLTTSSLMKSALARIEPASCRRTPTQPKGPFYPIHDQLDKDNDLTRVKDKAGVAQGQIVYVQGTVSDAQTCAPLADVLVEIWQACESGKYDHPGDPNEAALDPHFQYWGQCTTKADGRYLFKTIVPGAYPADVDWIRPAHIHYRVVKRGYRELITQMYFEGDRYNSTDKILQTLSPADQAQVVVRLESATEQMEPDAKRGAFDLALTRW
ncbi:MAG: hypothetical protein AB7P04_07750 [Bacteriovoracia bacterium]